jgi:hypothetical protein
MRSFVDEHLGNLSNGRMALELHFVLHGAGGQAQNPHLARAWAARLNHASRKPKERKGNKSGKGTARSLHQQSVGSPDADWPSGDLYCGTADADECHKTKVIDASRDAAETGDGPQEVSSNFSGSPLLMNCVDVHRSQLFGTFLNL